MTKLRTAIILLPKNPLLRNGARCFPGCSHEETATDHRGWAKIPSGLRNATVAFCIGEIWKPYFADHMPKEIICIGQKPAEVIMAAIPYQVTDRKSVETGWNNDACRYANQYGFDNDTTMIQIPHLSRFGIMTAPSCVDHLSAIFAPVRD